MDHFTCRLLDECSDMGKRIAWLQSENILLQVENASLKQQLAYALDRIEVLGGDPC